MKLSERALGVLLVLLAVLNGADYVLTLRSLAMGASELNPVMDAAIAAQQFALWKLVLPTLGIAGIWYLRTHIVDRRTYIVRLLVFTVTVYVAVVGWHVYHQVLTAAALP